MRNSARIMRAPYAQSSELKKNSTRAFSRGSFSQRNNGDCVNLPLTRQPSDYIQSQRYETDQLQRKSYSSFGTANGTIESILRPPFEANCLRILKDTCRRKRQAIVLDQAKQREKDRIDSDRSTKQEMLDTFWTSLDNAKKQEETRRTSIRKQNQFVQEFLKNQAQNQSAL